MRFTIAVTTPSFDAGALAYDRAIARASRLFIPALLEAAQIAASQRVLDVATGTGLAAEAAATLVEPSGTVLGVDISLPMLREATARTAGGRILLVAMDGQALACKDETFDAVICQLGLMFFADVPRGLQEFRRVLRPGGRLAVCVSCDPERTLYGRVAEAISRRLPAQADVLNWPARSLDAHRLGRLLDGADFHEIRVTRERREIVFESFDDYWNPVEAGPGAWGPAYRGLPEEARVAVREEIRQQRSPRPSDGRLVAELEYLFGLGRA